MTGVLRKKYLVFLPIPKIKFDPPHKEKCFGVHILGPLLNQQFFSDLEILKKIDFVSTPWKIIIPLGNSVGDPIWVTQMHLGG